jgi:acetate kinase
MPRVAQLLPIPRRYASAGVRRYGFHGLSYTYLLDELAHIDGPEAARGRLVLAHLGSGASMAAVREGKCVDTTMAFTPTAGLVMGTRTGDLDPGVLLYLMRSERMTAEQIDDLVNRQSGLLGVSGISPDMGATGSGTDRPNAARRSYFLWQVGHMAAAAGDTLVFSRGSARGRLRYDGSRGIPSARRPGCNAAGGDLETAAVIVRVIPTDEEISIARGRWPQSALPENARGKGDARVGW